MKRKIVPIAITSLLFGIVFDLFFFGKALGISIPLYVLLIIGATLYLGSLFKARLPFAAYALMPVTLFFASMIFIRASGMLLFFNFLLILYLLLLIVRLSTRPQIPLRTYSILQYFQGIPWLPFQFLRESTTELKQVLNDPANAKVDRSALKPVLRGLIITLPILVVLIVLLSSADMVFQKYVTSIFSFHINGELVWRIILAIVVAAVFAGGYIILFMRPAETSPEKTLSKQTVLGNIEMTIVLGSVELLFLLFLIVQATYFFGGEHHVLTTDFTYAEYARHGFFELIAVAVISLLLIWFIKQSAQLETGRQERIFKWLSVTLIAEVMVIMLSAHMRLSLYEQAYGYTRQRLLAHLFIYWLTAAFILAAVFIIRAEKESQFAFRLFVSVLAFFAVLNLMNPDALIASHNISRMEATGKIDAHSLTFLSEDATPVIASLLTSNVRSSGSGQTVRDIVARQLNRQKLAIDCGYAHWQSANIARTHAKNLLMEKDSQLSAGKDQNVTCVSGQLR